MIARRRYVMENWYVRIRGQVLGPLALGHIQAMHNSGQLQAFHEASTNRTDWKLAGDFPEIFPPKIIEPPPPLTPTPPLNRSRSHGSRAVVLVGGGALALIGLLAVVVVVLAVISRNNYADMSAEE